MSTWLSRVLAGVALMVLSTPQPLDGKPQRGKPLGAQRLVGAWRLDTRTVTQSDGTVIADPVLGDQPIGRLYYDASGVMMLQMMRRGRTAAIGVPTNPRDAANSRVVLGYDAYFGTYTVDERAGTITHRVEGSLFPEDLGKDFVRLFTLTDETLTLKFTSTADGAAVTRTLMFRRLR
jgi:lipocalin-like protein